MGPDRLLPACINYCEARAVFSIAPGGLMMLGAKTQPVTTRLGTASVEALDPLADTS
jgi:hypothetical protein